MSNKLEIYGPFKIPVAKKRITRLIGKSQVEKFLALLDEEGMSKKQGCYIFALRHVQGYSPYYIGQTTSTMREECMQQEQLRCYNDALKKEGKTGTPAMFIVAPEGSKKVVSKQIRNELETALIQIALIKNPNIRNLKKTQRPKWSIPGVIRGGRGRPTETAVKFKTMMGI